MKKKKKKTSTRVKNNIQENDGGLFVAPLSCLPIQPQTRQQQHRWFLAVNTCCSGSSNSGTRGIIIIINTCAEGGVWQSGHRRRAGEKKKKKFPSVRHTPEQRAGRDDVNVHGKPVVIVYSRVRARARTHARTHVARGPRRQCCRLRDVKRLESVCLPACCPSEPTAISANTVSNISKPRLVGSPTKAGDGGGRRRRRAVRRIVIAMCAATFSHAAERTRIGVVGRRGRENGPATTTIQPS